MMDLSQLPSNVRNLHINIAKDVYPDGAWVTCRVCNRTIEATTEMCASYLARGWPKCHGHQMRTESATKETP